MRKATIRKMDRIANQDRFPKWKTWLGAALFSIMLAIPQTGFSQLVGMKISEKGTPGPVGASLVELKKAYDEFRRTGSSELYDFCEQY
ncbi:hypothetical protein MJD09_01525 [bacterium]|nr:hypothetical protein [bacterium]